MRGKGKEEDWCQQRGACLLEQFTRYQHLLARPPCGDKGGWGHTLTDCLLMYNSDLPHTHKLCVRTPKMDLGWGVVTDLFVPPPRVATFFNLLYLLFIIHLALRLAYPGCVVERVLLGHKL